MKGFGIYRLHQGCASLWGPASQERKKRKKIGMVKLNRSKILKKIMTESVIKKVQNRTCNNNNSKGKAAMASIKKNRVRLAESRQCASDRFVFIILRYRRLYQARLLVFPALHNLA